MLPVSERKNLPFVVNVNMQSSRGEMVKGISIKRSFTYSVVKGRMANSVIFRRLFFPVLPDAFPMFFLPPAFI